jgi:hypothetical protein
LISKVWGLGGAIFASGFVKPSGWSDFTRIFDYFGRNVNYRIHGAYHGMCPNQFVVQLFGFLYRDIHLYNWEYKEDPKVMNYIGKMIKNRDIQKESNIRLGNVLEQ